ncbi:MAG: hypothetical protein CMC74_07205 [Flavobacteriaceae bacterium]|nr:hypothetical protein [Flavobacteriaceae bacterium]|tara:strand:- start:715 stop:1047 length:333 start_codon:yes stop_codon:yes gene_type:complete
MTTKENLKETVDLSQQLAEKEYEYAQLKVFYQIASVSSSVVKKSLFAFFTLIAALFLSIAAALWLGNLLESATLGFLWVGLFYVVLVSIALLFRKRIEKYVVNRLAKNYF